MIESNVAINLKHLCVASSWNLNPSITEGLRIVQEESVHSSWTISKMETANPSETLGTTSEHVTDHCHVMSLISTAVRTSDLTAVWFTPFELP